MLGGEPGAQTVTTAQENVAGLSDPEFMITVLNPAGVPGMI